jgi:Lon protease-like protein
VQDESPFKGTKRFGMCYVNSQGLSKYGTVLEITSHLVQPDGRLSVLNKGKQRFRLQSVKQEKPVLLCEVEMLEDTCDEETLKESAAKARDLFTNVVRMNARYRKIEVAEEHLVCPHAYSDACWPCVIVLFCSRCCKINDRSL